MNSLLLQVLASNFEFLCAQVCLSGLYLGFLGALGSSSVSSICMHSSLFFDIKQLVLTFEGLLAYLQLGHNALVNRKQLLSHQFKHLVI